MDQKIRAPARLKGHAGYALHHEQGATSSAMTKGRIDGESNIPITAGL
jgi:hypothetical protein